MAGGGVTTTVQGVDGATGVSQLTSDGFVPGDGTAGTSGGPGAWGVGGQGENPKFNGTPGDTYYGRAGAGGGAGGCAGQAGTPGTGGGASLGVLAIGSPLRLAAMTVESGAGGAAGKGTLGSATTDGLLAGDFDPKVVIPIAGRARGGDRGGYAGFSGSGAAGPSYGIVHRGGAPILITSQVKHGAGGAGAPERSVGVKTLPASPEGEAADLKEAP